MIASLNSARGKARDAKRLADGKAVQTALAMYYADNGVYPTSSGGWRGECSVFGSYTNTGATGYIPNLAPTYIPILPRDPNHGATSHCYLYKSNGENYAFMVYLTVEGVVPDSLKRPDYPNEKSYIFLSSPSYY